MGWFKFLGGNWWENGARESVRGGKGVHIVEGSRRCWRDWSEIIEFPPSRFREYVEGTPPSSVILFYII